MWVAGRDYSCAGCGLIGGGWSGSRRGIRTSVNLESNKINALERKRVGCQVLSLRHPLTYQSGSKFLRGCLAGPYPTHDWWIATRMQYLPAFVAVTGTRNTAQDSRNAPATMVSGSPMMGSQLPKRGHLRWRRYQFSARARCDEAFMQRWRPSTPASSAAGQGKAASRLPLEACAQFGRPLISV